jgi:hypothetical protein
VESQREEIREEMGSKGQWMVEKIRRPKERFQRYGINFKISITVWK